MEIRRFEEPREPGLRYSDVSFTVNTLIRPRTYEEYREYAEQLAEAIQSTLMTEEHLGFVLGHSHPEIQSVSMPAAGVELDSNKYGKRVHAHFTLEITHRTQLSYVEMSRRLKQFVMAEIPQSKGVYVHFEKMSSSAMKNYATKKHGVI